jgi:hypothetical protein
MELKRIGPLSAGKVLGIMSFVMGLVIGLITVVFSLATSAYFGDVFGDSSTLSMMFGFGSLLIMPFIYGVLGFIQGLIGAWLYNLIARILGGIHLELQ